MTGMPSRRTCSPATREVSGRQVDDIDYYCVLAKWKLAVVLEQGFQRAGDDPMLQAFGPVVLELMRVGRRAGRHDGLHGMSASGDGRSWCRSAGAPCSVLRLNRPEARNALTGALAAAAGRGPRRRPRPIPTSGPSCSPAPATGRSAPGMDLRVVRRRGRHGPLRRRRSSPASTAVCSTVRLSVPARRARPTAPPSPAASSSCSAATSSWPPSEARVRPARGQAGPVPRRRRHHHRARASRWPLALEMTPHRRPHRRRAGPASSGLVNTVVAPGEVLDTAVELAERIAANGPLGPGRGEGARPAVGDRPGRRPGAPRRMAAPRVRQRGRQGRAPPPSSRSGPPVWQGR